MSERRLHHTAQRQAWETQTSNVAISSVSVAQEESPRCPLR
jgi:hypothetical protein